MNNLVHEVHRSSAKYIDRYCEIADWENYWLS
jgi:hypothetical protein